MSNTGRQIKLGAMISYFSILLNIISGLVYTPWILKVVGTSNYGLYTLAISLISLFVMDFGVSVTVTRYVALFLAKGEKNKADSIIGLAYKCYLFIDIILAFVLVVVYIFINSIYQRLTPDELITFKNVYIIVAVYNVIQFPFVNLNGILNAYEKFIQLKIGDLVNKGFIVIVTVIVLLRGGNLYDLVLINAIGGLVTICFKLAMVKKYTDSKIVWKRDESIKIGEVVGFSAWSTVISLASRCIFLLTPSILGAVSGSVEIALFGFASTLENYVFSIANALNGLFLPRVSQISVGKHKERQTLELMVQVGRIQLVIIGLIIVGFAVVGDMFITDVWLGEEYKSIYYATLMLIIPSYINLPQQIANTAMTVENEVKSQAFVFVGMALISVVLAIPLSSVYGSIGACIAIFVAYMFRVIAMNFLYKTRLHIDIKSFFNKTFFRMTPWHCVIILVLILIKNYAQISGKTGFLILGITTVVVYSVVTFYAILTKEERQNILRKKWH